MFAGAGADADDRLAQFGTWMTESAASPLAATPAGLDRDAWFDVKVIYPRPHHEVDITTVPLVFRPRVGQYQLFDDEKVFALGPDSDMFEARGIDRGGVVVVVRPDQYVSNVLPLSATDELGDFFAPLFPAVATSMNDA